MLHVFTPKSLFYWLLVYLAVVGLLYIFQRDLIYFPSATYLSPAQVSANAAFREMDYKDAEGRLMKAWYAERGKQPYIIVFFHGNGDSLASMAPIANPFLAAGYGFLLVEYPGYSGMPGPATEENLYAGARAAIKRLVEFGITEKEIVLMGHSLGTGVATQMAGEFKVAGLVLLAPYTSLAKMAQRQYPVIPAEWLLKDRFDNFQKFPALREPLLLIHGETDSVIPASNSDELFALAVGSKTLKKLPAAGHNDLFAHGADGLIMNWLSGLSLPLD